MNGVRIRVDHASHYFYFLFRGQYPLLGKRDRLLMNILNFLEEAIAEHSYAVGSDR